MRGHDVEDDEQTPAENNSCSSHCRVDGFRMRRYKIAVMDEAVESPAPEMVLMSMPMIPGVSKVSGWSLLASKNPPKRLLPPTCAVFSLALLSFATAAAAMLLPEVDAAPFCL